jgi:hypothetical protein
MAGTVFDSMPAVSPITSQVSLPGVSRPTTPQIADPYTKQRKAAQAPTIISPTTKPAGTTGDTYASQKLGAG